jgi:hypothetical protein
VIPNARTLAVAGAAVAAVLVWFGLQSRSPGAVTVPAPPGPPAGAAVPLHTAVGNTGCMSAACHGNSAAKALSGTFDATTWEGSGTCWAARDPHTRAYSLLTDKPMRDVRATAAQIMERMHSPVPATEDARCLACHSNPALATHSSKDPHVVALRQEGVGCESCHGNGSGWLRPHTTWKADTKAEYVAVGMTPLFDVGDRAATCLGCHVGAPADPERGLAVRDMNHDMIAAGHPRLNFDFAEFHRELPKHWQEKERTASGPKPRGPEFDARLWLVGRVAQAEAACKLLASRAERAKAGDARTPWPELAEFNCAACHHDLFESWRSEEPARGDRSLGSLKWQTIWPVTAAAEFGAVRPVVTAMQRARPVGYREIGPVAQQSAAKLSELRQNLVGAADADLVSRSRQAFVGGIGENPEWDTDGQVLWGLAALQRSRLIDRPTGEFDRAFDAVRRRDWASARPLLDALAKP